MHATNQYALSILAIRLCKSTLKPKNSNVCDSFVPLCEEGKGHVQVISPGAGSVSRSRTVQKSSKLLSQCAYSLRGEILYRCFKHKYSLFNANVLITMK